jgi:hypothetical protein
MILWEVVTRAERPYSLLNDEQVFDNIQYEQHHLVVPTLPTNLTAIIVSCWQRNDFDRPSFSQLNVLFQQQPSLTIAVDHYRDDVTHCL